MAKRITIRLDEHEADRLVELAQCGGVTPSDVLRAVLRDGPELPTDVPGPMGRALTDALKGAQAPERDKAAVALARRYAHLLDKFRGEPLEQAVYNDLGPKLLACLTALGLTAAGRTPVKGGVPVAAVPAAVSPIDELRARRAKRAGVDGA